jgi:hypothetical protein
VEESKFGPLKCRSSVPYFLLKNWLIRKRNLSRGASYIPVGCIVAVYNLNAVYEEYNVWRESGENYMLQCFIVVQYHGYLSSMNMSQVRVQLALTHLVEQLTRCTGLVSVRVILYVGSI